MLSNPQPTPRPSVDSITPPGRVSLSRQTTFVTGRGDVKIADAKIPGTRKHVVATLGDVRVVGGNVQEPVSLTEPDDFCLLEWTGYDWTVIYGPRKQR
ncbi:MAG: hypothetical protein WD795_17035 [Woeseia sp.]